jgi:hypothetical protein
MLYLLAFVAFLIAAIFAFVTSLGISTADIIGIIAVGLALLALAGTGWPGTWPSMHLRRPVA